MGMSVVYVASYYKQGENMKYININLCSGIDIGRLAWDNAGLPKAEWHCFELDKYANAVGRFHYPDIVRHGDARNYTKLIGKKIFLLMGGFPCQPYSVAGKQKANSDERDLSELVFQALKDLKPKYFLFENVKMRKEQEDRISKELGVQAIEINSADFSAQNRNRLYWTNIPIKEWEDKGIVLQDILENGNASELMTNKKGKSHCITARYNGAVWWNSIQRRQRTMVQVGEVDNIKGFDSIKRIYSPNGKAPTLTTMQGGHREPKVAIGRIVNRRLDENGVRKDDQLELPFSKQIEISDSDKSNCLTTFTKDNVLVEGMEWRKLTPIECERLQTVPDLYTQYGEFDHKYGYLGEVKPISNSQRYKMLGNGWTTAVIEHIFKGVEA